MKDYKLHLKPELELHLNANYTEWKPLPVNSLLTLTGMSALSETDGKNILPKNRWIVIPLDPSTTSLQTSQSALSNTYYCRKADLRPTIGLKGKGVRGKVVAPDNVDFYDHDWYEGLNGKFYFMPITAFNYAVKANGAYWVHEELVMAEADKIAG